MLDNKNSSISFIYCKGKLLAFLYTCEKPQRGITSFHRRQKNYPVTKESLFKFFKVSWMYTYSLNMF